MPPELPAVRILIVDDDKAINDYVEADVPSDPGGYKALVDKDLPEVEAALRAVRSDQRWRQRACL